MAQNMYYDYRIRASKDNQSLRNREYAAEILGISGSSLANYETGKTKCVPAEMVALMAKAYKAPELRNIYCVSACPLGCENRIATSEPTIEQTAVHLLNRLDARVISSNLSEIIAIAEDGCVDADEAVILVEISKAFDQIAYAVSEFQILAERKGKTWNS